MLSRVAENVYWLARYVERAENTARVIMVNANLLLDLPKGFSTGWSPLISITGNDEVYRSRYADYDERNVVRFLVADPENGSSILSSLSAARENARTMREFVTREVWEEVNEMYLYAKDQVQSGLSKRGRYRYLRRIQRGAHTLAGVAAGSMNHDAGYEFLRTGRVLERGDMTTRIVDVRSATLLPEETSGLRPFENIQWISVLKSLSGFQAYRQRVQVRVRRADALRFLLQDEVFPRALMRCVCQAEASVEKLPRNEAPRRAIGRLKRTIQHLEPADFDGVDLHDAVDRLQIGLAQVHDELSRTYFLVQPDSGEQANAA